MKTNLNDLTTERVGSPCELGHWPNVQLHRFNGKLHWSLFSWFILIFLHNLWTAFIRYHVRYTHPFSNAFDSDTTVYFLSFLSLSFSLSSHLIQLSLVVYWFSHRFSYIDIFDTLYWDNVRYMLIFACFQLLSWLSSL